MSTTTSLKKCRGGRGHDDALALVEYLMARAGKVEKTNEQIALDLGMLVSRGGGMHQVDGSRFTQARRHVQDGTTGDGKPCSGYRLHYRTSAKGGEFVLIDPSGDLGPHATAIFESVRGWMVREQQHKTENLRQSETFDRLGDHALSRGDKSGYRLCARCSVELERDGTISPATIADLAVWIDEVQSAA